MIMILFIVFQNIFVVLLCLLKWFIQICLLQFSVIYFVPSNKQFFFFSAFFSMKHFRKSACPRAGNLQLFIHKQLYLQPKYSYLIIWVKRRFIYNTKHLKTDICSWDIQNSWTDVNDVTTHTKCFQWISVVFLSEW